jgi:hypothetical protein
MGGGGPAGGRGVGRGGRGCGAVPLSGFSHLFADSSLGDYNEEAAGLLKERTLTFLERVG